MSDFKNISADEALSKLKLGNRFYYNATTNIGNISQKLREETYEKGQHPYAIVVTCSESRVIPESIFCASIGDLFTIRAAGNVIDVHQL